MVGNKKRIKNKKVFSRFKIIASILLIITIPSFAVYSKIKSELNKSVWDDKGRISLVLAAKPAVVATYNPIDGNLTVISLPENLYCEVPFGYGTYKINNIWKLSRIERKNGTLYSLAVRDALRAPIDGWLGNYSAEVEELNKINKEKIQKYLKNFKNPLSVFQIFKYDTNLSFFDLLKLWNAVRNIPGENINYSDLSKFAVFLKSAGPDKINRLTIDSNEINSYSSPIFEDKAVRIENLSISIVNASDIAGLGEKLKNILENMGGRVIDLKNSSQKERTICRAGKNIINTMTMRKIKRIINCAIEEKPAVSSDLEIIIGSEY